jgi:uncharacterized protein with GYD domain
MLADFTGQGVEAGEPKDFATAGGKAGVEVDRMLRTLGRHDLLSIVGADEDAAIAVSPA